MLRPKYCITKVNKDVLPKYCITKVNKNVLTRYCITKVNKDVWPKHCITKVNKRCFVLQSIVLQRNKVMTKVLYYKSKQRYYDQSIVLQK